MILTGENYRKVQEKSNYNFSLTASVSNATGSSVFGFSGESQKFEFNFDQGRILDPNNNYVFSYSTGQFKIEANVNDDNYNYFINDERINFSGSKSDFAVDRFFVDSTGCVFELETLTVNGSGGQTVIETVSFDSAVGDSGVVSGTVTANNIDLGRFDIFSGEILSNQFTGLFDINTSISTGILGTGDFLISGIDGIENQSIYTFDVTFHTSFGESTNEVVVSGTTPFYQPTLELDELQSLLDLSGSQPLLKKTGEFVASHTLYTGTSTLATGLPLKFTLSYDSGFTGDVQGALTGVQVLNSGENYSSFETPSVIISGNGSGAIASSFISPQGDFSGINIINGGSGYNSSTEILISSGVNSVNIINAGFGFFSVPVVQFSGEKFQGGDAQADAVVDGNGGLAGFNVTSGGSYFVTPEITLIPGLSGINLTFSGSGYTEVPAVLVEGGGGSGASFQALTGFQDGFGQRITGINLISGGSGYTGVPTVTFSGGSTTSSGSGVAVLSSGFSGNLVMTSGASASGFFGDYTKDFTGVFNLLTGSGESFYNFRENGQISSDNLSYTGNAYVFTEDLTLSLGVQSELNAQIENINYYDNLFMSAVLVASGSGDFSATGYVTGVK